MLSECYVRNIMDSIVYGYYSNETRQLGNNERV
jgi:hypothetical protein